MIPVELIHGPRRDRRLGKRLHQNRLTAMTALLQPRSECVARGCELCQWEAEQSINIIAELNLRLADQGHFIPALLFTISHLGISLSLFSALHQLIGERMRIVKYRRPKVEEVVGAMTSLAFDEAKGAGVKR